MDINDKIRAINKLKKDDAKIECQKLGIKTTSRMKRDDLRQLLINHAMEHTKTKTKIKSRRKMTPIKEEVVDSDDEDIIERKSDYEEEEEEDEEDDYEERADNVESEDIDDLIKSLRKSLTIQGFDVSGFTDDELLALADE